MTPLRMTVVLESPQELAPSMDRCGQELLRALRRWPTEVDPVALQLGMPRLARRLPRVGERHAALNADRMAARFGSGAARVLAARPGGGVVHIVDHVYANLARLVPRSRVGVYCHDLDAFEAVLHPDRLARSFAFRAMVRQSLGGLSHAGVVFHSTRSMGNQLVELGVVERDRLVQAPFGVAPEFSPNAPPGKEPPAVLSAIAGRPYLLNVAGAIPRKRLDVLVAAFRELRRRHPELLLVQVGARTLPTADPDTAAAILQPGPVDDLALAALYRGAAAVCLTSQAEGFGLPVLEALACGAPVVSSDLENVREVAGDAALYLPVGDVPAWVDLVDELLEGRLTLPTLSQRLDQAAPFTWERHARIVLDGYRRLTS